MGVFNTNSMLANVYGRLSAAGPSAAGPSATIEHSSIYIYSIYFGPSSIIAGEGVKSRSRLPAL